MIAHVADLEKLAIQRDRGYLVRLVLLLAVAVVVGLWAFAWLTGASTSSCIAESFGSAPSTGQPSK